jgi:integrase
MGKPDAASSCPSGLEGAGRKRTPAKEQRAALPPYATLLINQGMPIASLQKLLGHQNINKTMIYARVHDQTVKEQFYNAMNLIESILVMDWPK